jgi:hypothetical protein
MQCDSRKVKPLNIKCNLIKVFENIQLSGIFWFKRQRKGKEYTMTRRFVRLLFTKPGLEKQNGVSTILYFR